MASGPDGVTPVPGCVSWQETLSSHLYCQSLPQARHPRTVPLILTSSHYTRAMMKQINWITAPSHFSVCVVRSWGLVSPLQLHHIFVKMTRAINQWAYKKGHSTERRLIGMTEDWRQALDNSLLVGVVFEDFQKAFYTVSHSLLLQKVQGLWSWIRDYMSTVLRQQLLMATNQRGSLWSMGFLKDRWWVLHYFHFSSYSWRWRCLTNLCGGHFIRNCSLPWQGSREAKHYPGKVVWLVLQKLGGTVKFQK